MILYSPVEMYQQNIIFHVDDDTPKSYKPIIWKWLKIASISVLIILLLIFITLFIIVPIVFKFSIKFQTLVMFTNINLPADKEYYQSFEEHGLHNFYITVENQNERRLLSLGAWHLLPERLKNTSNVDGNFNYTNSLMNTNYSVLLYFHGSGETRADLIKKCYRLRLLFHVIIFDYRDYADSTPATLSEGAIVEDSVYLFNWLRSITNAKIYVWGHSLGTPLSSNTISHLRSSGIVPHGLILESPMTSMREEIPYHPYGKIFSWLPWFELTILDPLDKNGFKFATIKYILNIECPIMILHAEDDSIIPYTLGEKLYYYAVTQRNASYGSAVLHLFSKKCEHDHFFIYEDEKFIFYISEFMVNCDNYAKKRSVNV